MKKLLGYFIVIAVAAVGIWYFLIKEDHYSISFTSKQPKAIVFNHVLDWKANASNGINSIYTASKIPHSEIIQRIKIGDSTFRYRWKFSKKNDSLTQVQVGILDKENGFVQKLQVPFSKNNFVKRSIRNVKEVGEGMAEQGKLFKVHSIKDTLFPERFSVYLPLESKVAQKAPNMLRSIPDLMGYLNENEISLQGHPYVEVTSWNKEDDTMTYNFCFPIKKTDSLPKSELIQFKTSPSFRALRAEYNGNFAISKNAWYYLIEYAELNGIAIKELPTEMYLNDPQSGGNSIDWRAHIYVPIIE